MTVTKSLAQLRTEIDAVDQELLTLLNRRAGFAHEVGEIKKVEGSPVYRPEREAQVILGLQNANPGPLKPANIATIWREIMSACRALEAPQRVAYLGPAGTFSEQAAVNFFGASIEHVACASFDEVFHAAAAGTADFGVVPVENSTEGVVTRSLDLLLQSPLHIVGEISLLVRHHLLRQSASLEGIEAVLAHPQALAHSHLGQPQAGQQAPGRWGEPLALAQGGLSLGNVFATQTPVVAGVHPPQGNGDELALNLHHFMRHHGVQPSRHDGPGGDAQALTRLGRRTGPGRARQGVAHALQHRWLGGGQVRTGESKAIHGRVVVGRDIDGGHHIAGQDAFTRGHDRQGLDRAVMPQGCELL